MCFIHAGGRCGPRVSRRLEVPVPPDERVFRELDPIGRLSCRGPQTRAPPPASPRLHSLHGDGAEQDRARSVHAHHAPRSYGRGGAAGRVAERGARETESEMLVLSREMDSYWPVELKASNQCPKRKAYEVCVVSRVWVWPCAWKQAYGNGISRKRIPSPLRYRVGVGMKRRLNALRSEL